MAVAVRRLPIGAEPQTDGTVHFRVWAPKCRRVDLVLEDERRRTFAMSRDEHGYFEAACPARAGTRYRFQLDGEGDLLPDPASRWQPDGPHGPSAVVDPAAFRWTDDGWRGVREQDVIVYELHVGTFTREGTWRAAAERLPALAELGITAIEMMPIAEFDGRFGWGYDGVDLFAPTHLYGAPDDMRAFVDRAHAAGLAVILDVVYNHFGPSGAYFDRFSDHYFTQRDTEWGRAINFDGPGCEPVREFFVTNAGYWIDEYHLDGLRLDAVQSIGDRSTDHIVAAVVRRAREAAGRRTVWIVAENEKQESEMVRSPDAGGHGLNALWNDDFHHSAIVALTGRREAYYTDYLGHPQEFVSAAKHGFLYQGQWYRWQFQPRGRPALDLPPTAFVTFLENHDQVANSGLGQRLHQTVSPSRLRAFTGLLMLGPWVPMLFQGQEFASHAPFLYFADHGAELAAAVRKGRSQFLKQFPRLALPEMQARLHDPADASAFERCKLDHDDRDRHPAVWQLHADLLRLRRTDPTIAAHGRHGFDGAVLGTHGFVLRFFGAPGTHDDRLLVVNIGPDELVPVVPEPLLAPPARCRWRLIWSSEDPTYGGLGVPQVEADPGWRLPAESTLLFAAAVGPADVGHHS